MAVSDRLPGGLADAVRRRPAPGGTGGGDFLVADDPRTADARCGYVLAAYDYLEAWTAFCEAPDCRLHDAHRQPAPVETQLREAASCARHARPFDDG